MSKNYFGARSVLTTHYGSYNYFSLGRLEQDGLVEISRLPFSIRVMLEAVLRQCNEREITRQDVINLAGWNSGRSAAPIASVHPSPGADAGLHRRAGGCRPGRDAGGDGTAGRRSWENQPAGSG